MYDLTRVSQIPGRLRSGRYVVHADFDQSNVRALLQEISCSIQVTRTWDRCWYPPIAMSDRGNPNLKHANWKAVDVTCRVYNDAKQRRLVRDVCS